jgi:hypothetical protein
MEKNKGVRLGGDTMSPPDNTPKLKDLGIEKKQSMRWQQKALGKKNCGHDVHVAPSLG